MLKKVIDYILKSRLFERLTEVDRLAVQRLNEQGTARKELDRRLQDITKATIDGENGWFLKLVRNNPDCALDVIKECDLKNDK